MQKINRRKAQYFYISFVLAMVAFFSGCSASSSRLPLRVIAFNNGENGVVLRKFPGPKPSAEFPSAWNIYPKIDGYSEGKRGLLVSENVKRKLPKNVTIIWQLVKLKNCDSQGCDWTNKSGKTFSKTVDLAEKAQSAQRRAGSDPRVDANCLKIKLNFNEHRLLVDAVKVHYGGTDPVPCHGSVAVN